MKGLLKSLRQKSTWIGISGIGAGVVLILQGNVDAGVQTIIGGASVIFLREAIAKTK